MGTIQIFLIL